MCNVITFLILSIPIVIISWRSIISIRSHGFYRFIAWECILWLVIANLKYWFKNPFSLPQIVSWCFLSFSLYLIVFGLIKMTKIKRADTKRDKSLYQFENTSELTDTGIFKFIRHPLYSSLLFLTWGVFLKHMDYFLLIVAVISTIALYFTSKIEEKENIRYFGEEYNDYKRRTKMFVPFLF